jgi:hypothetical protein
MVTTAIRDGTVIRDETAIETVEITDLAVTMATTAT